MEELIQKIMLKAYEVNNHTKHNVFVEFLGHVNWFNVRIHINGWKEYSEPDIKVETRLHKETAIENLQYMLTKLEELEKNIEGAE